MDEDGKSIGVVVGAASGAYYGYQRSMSYVGGEISSSEELSKVITATAVSAIAGGVAGYPNFSGVAAVGTAVLVSEAAVQLVFTGKIDPGKLATQTIVGTAGALTTTFIPGVQLLNPNPQSVAVTIIGGSLSSLLYDNIEVESPSNYVEINNSDDREEDKSKGLVNIMSYDD